MANGQVMRRQPTPRRPPVPANRATPKGGRPAPPQAQGQRQGRPMPQQRPSAPPQGTPRNRGNRGEQEAKNIAISKASQSTGMPPEALADFTLLELQVLPSILQKMSSAAQAEGAGQPPTAPPQGGRGSGGPTAPKGRAMRPPSRQQANDEFAREIPMKSPARGRQPVMR